MEFTGERYIPSLNGDMKYEHLHRYAVCRNFVQKRNVLDIASGEGYGSALLAKIAGLVVGIDIDPEAIEHAKQQYKDYKNLKYMVGSCDSIPLPDNSFDVVTSFETIEHHDRHEEMMQEIKRVLKPTGILIISSPNRLEYSEKPEVSNPFHVKELNYEEIAILLNRYFKYVQISGQRLAIASFVFPLKEGIKSNFTVYTGNIDSLEARITSLNSPIYFVAVCSDESAILEKSIDSVYIDPEDDLLKKYQAEIEGCRSQLQKKHEELHSLQSRIADIERSTYFKLKTAWIRLKKRIKNWYH